jgi:hypothetical protein
LLGIMVMRHRSVPFWIGEPNMSGYHRK